MTFENILISTITVFLVVGIGWFCQSVKIIDEAAEKSLMTLAINVLYPCFILSKILGNDLLRQSTVVTAAMSVGLVLIMVAFAVCFFAGRLIGLTSDSGLNTFTRWGRHFKTTALFRSHWWNEFSLANAGIRFLASCSFTIWV